MFKRKAKTAALSNLQTQKKKSKSLETIPENLPYSSLRSLPIIKMHQDSIQTQSTSHIAQQNIVQTSQNMQEIFNSLRIPDVIKDLPSFDGNPRLLYDFITNVEEILLFLKGTEKTPYGQILLRAIRNKVVGTANELLNTYLTQLDWEEIKTNLISAFSDKRTETTLIRDLHNIRQTDRTIEQFHTDIIEIQAALLNNILINEKDQKIINSKRELFSEMCLNTFLSGLKDPLGATIRAMRPDSLPTALAYCIKEQNITSAKQVQKPHKPHQPNTPPPYHKFPRPYYGQFNPEQRQFNRPQFNRYSNNNWTHSNHSIRNAIMPVKIEASDGNTTRTNFRQNTPYSYNRTGITRQNFLPRSNSNFHNINQTENYPNFNEINHTETYPNFHSYNQTKNYPNFHNFNQTNNHPNQEPPTIPNIDDTQNFRASASRIPPGI